MTYGKMTWETLVSHVTPPPGITSPEEASAAYEAALESDDDRHPIVGWYAAAYQLGEDLGVHLPAALFGGEEGETLREIAVGYCPTVSQT